MCSKRRCDNSTSRTVYADAAAECPMIRYSIVYSVPASWHATLGGLAAIEVDRHGNPQREAESADQRESQPRQTPPHGQTGAGSLIVIALRHTLIQMHPPATAPLPTHLAPGSGSIRYLDHASEQGGSGRSGPDTKRATDPGTLPRRHRRMATVAEPAEHLLYRPEEAAKALRIGRSMAYDEIRLGRRRLVPPEYIARTSNSSGAKQRQPPCDG